MAKRTDRVTGGLGVTNGGLAALLGVYPQPPWGPLPPRPPARRRPRSHSTPRPAGGPPPRLPTWAGNLYVSEVRRLTWWSGFSPTGFADVFGGNSASRGTRAMAALRSTAELKHASWRAGPAGRSSRVVLNADPRGTICISPERTAPARSSSMRGHVYEAPGTRRRRSGQQGEARRTPIGNTPGNPRTATSTIRRRRQNAPRAARSTRTARSQRFRGRREDPRPSPPRTAATRATDLKMSHTSYGAQRTGRGGRYVSDFWAKRGDRGVRDGRIVRVAGPVTAGVLR
jgi:hypothetical protein